MIWLVSQDVQFAWLILAHNLATLWDPDVADVISAIMQILIVSLNFLKERCWLLIKKKG